MNSVPIQIWTNGSFTCCAFSKENETAKNCTHHESMSRKMQMTAIVEGTSEWKCS